MLVWGWGEDAWCLIDGVEACIGGSQSFSTPQSPCVTNLTGLAQLHISDFIPDLQTQ